LFAEQTARFLGKTPLSGYCEGLGRFGLEPVGRVDWVLFDGEMRCRGHGGSVCLRHGRAQLAHFSFGGICGLVAQVAILWGPGTSAENRMAASSPISNQPLQRAGVSFENSGTVTLFSR
jgi:hypothetical protein